MTRRSDSLNPAPVSPGHRLRTHPTFPNHPHDSTFSPLATWRSNFQRTRLSDSFHSPLSCSRRAPPPRQFSELPDSFISSWRCCRAGEGRVRVICSRSAAAIDNIHSPRDTWKQRWVSRIEARLVRCFCCEGYRQAGSPLRGRGLAGKDTTTRLR